MWQWIVFPTLFGTLIGAITLAFLLPSFLQVGRQFRKQLRQIRTTLKE